MSPKATGPPYAHLPRRRGVGEIVLEAAVNSSHPGTPMASAPAPLAVPRHLGRTSKLSGGWEGGANEDGDTAPLYRLPRAESPPPDSSDALAQEASRARRQCEAASAAASAAASTASRPCDLGASKRMAWAEVDGAGADACARPSSAQPSSGLPSASRRGLGEKTLGEKNGQTSSRPSSRLGKPELAATGSRSKLADRRSASRGRRELLSSQPNPQSATSPERTRPGGGASATLPRWAERSSTERR